MECCALKPNWLSDVCKWALNLLSSTFSFDLDIQGAIAIGLFDIHSRMSQRALKYVPDHHIRESNRDGAMR